MLSVGHMTDTLPFHKYYVPSGYLRTTRTAANKSTSLHAAQRAWEAKSSSANQELSRVL